MRRIWILTTVACVLGGLAGIAPNSFARQPAGEVPPPTSQARPHLGQTERELQKMSETLNLTEEQKVRIRPILQERNQQLKDLRAQSSLPQGYARKKATEIRKSARQRINLILTPQQREEQKATRRKPKVLAKPL
jgi:Spy/CpxP family protein refolding chaperone